MKGLKNMEDRNDIVVLYDDEGKEFQFEILDIIEYNDDEYAVGLPADTPEDEEESTVFIMKIVHENDDEDILEPVKDEEELNAVFEIFKEHMDDEFEFVEE